MGDGLLQLSPDAGCGDSRAALPVMPSAGDDTARHLPPTPDCRSSAELAPAFAVPRQRVAIGTPFDLR
ncbi:hypothetical protein ACMGDM_08695 [Sphingomonas sp. DT-51]|uniref:hypothetical protein n=1 Tax=Sphingomonas sp. DT-51 TaxID=3396165 RepID=UPI003F1E303C